MERQFDDVEIIGMLRSYVNASLVGVGALKGAPCQIQGVTDNEDGTQTITFLWKDTDDEDHTQDVTVPSPIVALVTPQNGQILVYNSTSGKFENASLTYDSSLNGSSENAPQTKAVYDALDDKVDKEEGKGLSANDFTNSLKTKLDGIESGAEVNTIEIVKLNGTAITPGSDKDVDIEAIESISVNGVSQSVEDGSVDLDVATNLITDEQWAQIQALLA